MTLRTVFTPNGPAPPSSPLPFPWHRFCLPHPKLEMCGGTPPPRGTSIMVTWRGGDAEWGGRGLEGDGGNRPGHSGITKPEAEAGRFPCAKALRPELGPVQPRGRMPPRHEDRSLGRASPPAPLLPCTCSGRRGGGRKRRVVGRVSGEGGARWAGGRRGAAQLLTRAHGEAARRRGRSGDPPRRRGWAGASSLPANGAPPSPLLLAFPLSLFSLSLPSSLPLSRSLPPSLPLYGAAGSGGDLHF